jgi:hypothetical protein
MKKPKVHIGIEIEVNHINGVTVDQKKWQVDGEHCGFELRSAPCKSPGEIRTLLKSIEQMGKNATTTFENTGTHLHIDFLNDNNVSVGDLSRLQAPVDEAGLYLNPLGTGKRYFWSSPDGAFWASPKDYMNVRAPHIKPNLAYVNRGKYVDSVKRFLLLGKRFANVLFGLQHPCRRFNKYCHTIAHWDEEILMATKTVAEICGSPKLLQSHRRHMFNPMAFQKFGTVEVRMIMGTLDYQDIWEQIYLFGKMAQLAKSDNYIPVSTGSIMGDFFVLMGACGIHGKMRHRLEARFTTSIQSPLGLWTARCFKCEEKKRIDLMFDFGLSRPICGECCSYNQWCAWCGYGMASETGYSFDFKCSTGERYLCRGCHKMGARKEIKIAEKDGTLCVMGTRIGCGSDENGPMTLRSLNEIFKC